ncbi:MAG: hypothetical protein ACR2QS_17070 [Woeseiaceae bacterium]
MKSPTIREAGNHKIRSLPRSRTTGEKVISVNTSAEAQQIRHTM